METLEKMQLKSQQPAGRVVSFTNLLAAAVRRGTCLPAGLQGSRAKIYREPAQHGGGMVADNKTGLW